MSIDKTQPLKPVSTVQPRDASDNAGKVRQNPAPAAPAASEKSAEVSRSSSQAQLLEPSSRDINTANVERIKTALRNGDLKMDAGKIADALIADTRKYLEGN